MTSRSVDFTRFSTTGDPTVNQGVTGYEWWREEGDAVAASVGAALGLLHEQQTQRRAQAVLSARLYGNIALAGMYGIDLNRFQSGANQLRDRISYNVIQSVIDTKVSKLTKNKPKPLFLTTGGDYRQIRRAKRLNKFVDGMFYEQNFYALGQGVYRDSQVFDAGVVKVFAHDDRVCYERVLSTELLLDEVEAFYGHPRTLYQVKPVDRRMLMDAFPKKADKLRELSRSASDGTGRQQLTSDLIMLRESWHLPSGPDADDGRHALTVDGVSLLDDDEMGWDRDYFPFAFLKPTARLTGFWGQPAAERLQNPQLEINKLLWVIQRSMHISGTNKILVENSSKIVDSHHNNEIGTIIKYTGTKPEYVVPPMVQPEVYAHLERLVRMAFEQEGTSMLSAASKKPEGLDSGKALREFNDIESERFLTEGRAYEQFALDVARLSIETIRRDLGGSYKVKTSDGKKVTILDWKDVKLEEDDYVMQCFPVSSLPSEPSGRLQTVQEYVQAGFLTPRQGRRLLDFPDLDGVENLANASEEYLAMVMDKIVEDGEYTAPEPQDDLGLAYELALETYQLSKCQGVEEEKLELLRRFMGDVMTLQQSATPQGDAAGAPAAPPAGPPAPPQGAPAAPPVSDLMPFH